MISWKHANQLEGQHEYFSQNKKHVSSECLASLTDSTTEEATFRAVLRAVTEQRISSVDCSHYWVFESFLFAGVKSQYRY